MDATVQPRRSRVRRQSRGKRLSLSPRDIDLFGLLERYRYLRSSFICAFFADADRTGLVKRLGDLFHEGYLDRPIQQYQYANALYLPAVYELNERSIAVLRECGRALHSRPAAPRHFSHQLMISDSLASIELGTREGRLRFIPAYEIMSKAPCRTLEKPFHFPTQISHQGMSNNFSVVPDALFGLEYQTQDGNSYRFFALEVDRNTMPVARGRLEQSSYLRKLLGYRDVLLKKTHHSYLGVPNFFILTVTQNEAHMRNIMRLSGKLISGKPASVFLFKTMGSLGDGLKAPLPTPHMLTEPWERQGYAPFSIAEASSH